MNTAERVKRLREQDKAYVLIDIIDIEPEFHAETDAAFPDGGPDVDTIRGYVTARIEDGEAIYEYDGEVRSTAISRRCVRPTKPVYHGELLDVEGDDAE
jgi:hypothetical protein